MTVTRNDATEARLISAASLEGTGLTARRLPQLARAGSLVRLRHGVYVDAHEWDALRPEARSVTRARAWALTSADEPVFSHETAAAIHGLPVVRPRSAAVHTIVPESRNSRAPGIVRHRCDPRGDHVERVNGLLVTDAAQTVADLARTTRPETALSAADAALRAAERASGAGAAERLRSLILAERLPPGRIGRRAARWIIGFADPRSDRPGESISRLYLHRLGFAPPRLQVPVPGPDGRPFAVDFGLDDANAFGEFDGVDKYVDEGMLAGRSAEQVVLAEKRREDWIRGTTQRRFARWSWGDLASPERLGSRLAQFSIVPPRGGF